MKAVLDLEPSVRIGFSTHVRWLDICLPWGWLIMVNELLSLINSKESTVLAHHDLDRLTQLFREVIDFTRILGHYFDNHRCAWLIRYLQNTFLYMSGLNCFYLTGLCGQLAGGFQTWQECKGQIFRIDEEHPQHLMQMNSDGHSRVLLAELLVL